MTESLQTEVSGLATPEEMALAIESSGYLIEARIGRVLTEKGFFVQRNIFSVSPNDSTKTFEIDVVGRRGEFVSEENKSSVSASVLVECKNNSQPVAFFVQEQEITELNDNLIRYGGYPAFSMDQDSKIQVPLHRLLEMKDWHHYCQAKEVATQFCSFTRTSKKIWKAEPNENYAKGFSNLALAAIRDWEGMFGLQLPCIQIQMSYPVVVFQGPVYRVVERQGSATVEPTDHVQLHHGAILNGQAIPVQIDVTTEKYFPILVDSLVSELATFRDRVKGLYDRLLLSALDQKDVASRVALSRLAGLA